jgi:ammonium transporter, Amt family
MDTGDTAFVLMSAALVLLMTPGLALFYGGMVRSQNVLSTFMHSVAAMGVISLQWVLFGYSLSFAESGSGGFVGGLDFAFLRGVGVEPQADSSVPHLAFMAFQMMFAIITPALISGAVAERVRFAPYLIFIVLWATLVYDPVCHWVWGPEGWLGGGADFAGGLVVHLSSGAAALVFALVLGKRNRPRPPHNLTMTVLGAALLWFGWFGFNAGSALGANGEAALAFVNTHVASATALSAWCAAEWFKHGKPTALGAASGLVAGLVAITPAAGYVSPMAAIAIGAAAGVVCFGAVLLKTKLGYDDALDAFGVHGVGGALGAVLTGAFATVGAAGLVTGEAELFVENIKGVVVVFAYSGAVSYALLKVLDVTIGLRVTETIETEGLDLTMHGENGYSGLVEG